MFVKLKAGPVLVGDRSFAKGSTIEVPDARGKMMLNLGHAEAAFGPVAEPPAPVEAPAPIVVPNPPADPAKKAK